MTVKKIVAMLVAVLMVFTVFASNGLEVYAALSKGDKNSDVAEMQKKLIALGYLKDSADGSYGPATQTAVKSFETANGIKADGQADDKMLSKLSSIYESTPSIKITSSSAVVRKGAGTSYAKIGTASKDATYKIIESKVVSSSTWYKIAFKEQLGWIAASSVSLSYGDSARIGTITSNDVNSRTGAGTSYSVYKTLNKGYEFNILGEKTVSGTVWYSFIYSGRTLWVSGKYVTVKNGGTTESTKTTTTTKATTTTKEDPTSTTTKATTVQTVKKGTVTGSTVNVRKGAGTGYTKVTSVKKGYTFTITGEKKVSGTTWYSFKRNGATVWIIGTYVKVTTSTVTTTTTKATTTTKSTTSTKEDTTSTTTKATTAQTVKKGTVTGSTVNVRKGAGTGYTKVTSVKKGYTFTITGEKKVSGITWYSFKRNGATVWIIGTYVKVTTTTITTTTNTTTTTKATETTASTTKPTSATSGTTSPTDIPASETDATSTTKSTTTTSTTKATTAADEEDDNLYGKVDVSSSLNVRKSASSTSSKLGTLSDGDYVVIVDYTSKSGWYKIIYGSGFGWVSSKYIKLVDRSEYISDVEFSKDYFYVDQGKTKTIAIAGIKGATYTSSDAEKLSISAEGVVKGIEPGMYTVTAKYGASVATAEVIVLKAKNTLTEEQKNMGMSEEGVKFIADWEGGGSTNPDILEGKVLVFEPYKDASGYWTVGYGHAKTTTASKSWSKETAIKEFAKDIEAYFGDEIELSEEKPYLTKEEAQKLLMADLNQGPYVSAVRGWAVRNGVILSQSQFDSLVSFTYNLGTSYWTSDTKRFYLKCAIIARRNGDEADAEQVTEGFSRYIRSGSKYLKGLYFRRMNEAEMFTAGDYGIERANKFPLPSGINWS